MVTTHHTRIRWCARHLVGLARYAALGERPPALPERDLCTIEVHAARMTLHELARMLDRTEEDVAYAARWLGVRCAT